MVNDYQADRSCQRSGLAECHHGGLQTIAPRGLNPTVVRKNENIWPLCVRDGLLDCRSWYNNILIGRSFRRNTVIDPEIEYAERDLLAGPAADGKPTSPCLAYIDIRHPPQISWSGL